MKDFVVAFSDLNKLFKKFGNKDPNTERLSLLERNINGALSDYKQIYDEEILKRKQ